MELRRQEAEVLKTRIMAQGFIDVAEHGANATADVFQKYAAAALPFMSKQKTDTDEKMKKELESWTKRGVITFEAPQANPLRDRIKEMRIDQGFRERLAMARKRASNT